MDKSIEVINDFDEDSDIQKVQNVESTIEKGEINERTERSNSSLYNDRTREVQTIHEEYASAYNHHIIVDRINRGTARDISQEPKVKNTAAFIIASGPSLDESIRHMRDWKGGIICTTSHALTFIRHGIEPTHILALDPFCYWREIEGIDWSKTRTKLITTPGVWPDLIEKWPNEMLLYRQNVGRTDSFYNTVQKRMYTYREGDREKATFHFLIPTDITQFACSPPAQMFAADLLGYAPIFMAGLDFGYNGGKTRFTDYTVAKPATRYEAGNGAIEIPPTWDEHQHLVDGKDHANEFLSNNGMWTHKIHVYYRKNFISAWRLSLQNVWSTDTQSIVTELPYADAAVVVRRQGKGYKAWRPDKIKKVSEIYLASVGAFVIQHKKGSTFVESTDPENEIVAFIKNANRKYTCTKCGALMVSNTDETQVGAECPMCHEKAVDYQNYVDLESNMERVRKRLKQANEVYGEVK